MKCKVLLELLVLASVSLAFGCSRPATLSGQMFVVTKGRDNVKLGLVQVQAIPEAGLKDFVEEKAKGLLGEYEAGLAKFRTCRDTLSKLEKLPEAERATLGPEFSKNCSDADEFEKSTFGRTVVRMQELAEGGPFIDAVPTSTTLVTKTDADGRYTLALRRGERYAIVAKTERTVPGKDKPEHYRWLLWVLMDAEKKELLLSNDNMMTENPVDAVIRLPKLPVI